MGNALNTHVFATRFKQRYRAVRKDERYRNELYCCFKNATTTFRVVVDRNLFDEQTDKIGNGAFSFFVKLCLNVFDAG